MRFSENLFRRAFCFAVFDGDAGKDHFGVKAEKSRQPVKIRYVFAA